MNSYFKANFICILIVIKGIGVSMKLAIDAMGGERAPQAIIKRGIK